MRESEHQQPGTTAPRPDFREVISVLATGGLFLVLKDGRWMGPFIIAAALLWLAYVVVRVHKAPRVLDEWGFRRKNLAPTLLWTSAVFAISGGAMAAHAAVQGSLVVTVRLGILFALYPLWGWIQQFLVQALVVRNMERHRLFSSPLCLVPSSAVLFALVHAPYVPLMLATFGLGLVFTPIYLRWRNLWPLGLYHGWLGALFYVWVLGRDPLLEAFG